MATIFPLLVGLVLAAGEPLSRYGASLGGVDQNLATLLDLPEATGAVVLSLEPGSLAAQAGLAKRDVILAAGGRKVADPAAVATAIDTLSPTGGQLPLEVWRGGERKSLTLTIPPPPPVAPGSIVSAAPATLELTATETDRQMIQRLIKTLNDNHVAGHPLDDEIAERALGELFDYYDGNRVYLLQADVDNFRRRAARYDDQLAAGDFSLAFEVYRAYLGRVIERVALVEKLLDEPHDFTRDEFLPVMVESRFRSEDEAREYWRKRVKYELLVHKSAGADEEEARRRVLRMYQDVLAAGHRIQGTDLAAYAANALAHSYDAQSSYIAPPQLANFETNLSGQLVGVGLQLQMNSGYASVVKVIPGGPAAKEGSLKSGCRIVAIGEGDGGVLADVVNVKLTDVVALLRGPRGSKVRLKYLPAGEFEASFCTLTRDTVEFSRIAFHVFTDADLPAGRRAKVGYVYMPLFYRPEGQSSGGRIGSLGVTGDVGQKLQEFRSQEVDVVVLDLRDNSGGSLTEAINFPGLFVGSANAVAQLKGRDGKVITYSPDKIEQAWNGPLVVLTSRATAGGAEMVAGIVQDTGRGLVIGAVKTHGVGEVGSLQKLQTAADGPNLGEVKVVTQKLYRPGGASIQQRGVAADVAIPEPWDIRPADEASKPYALRYDEVPAARFDKLDFGVNDGLRQALAEASATRREKSPYFQYLAGRIARAQSQPVEQVSLRLDQFVARQKQLAELGEGPTIPEIPEVKLDDGLIELLLVSLDYTSRELYARAEKEYGERKYAQGLALYERALAADPANARAGYKLAWNLATCPQTALRNGKRGVEVGTIACETDGWKSWQFIFGLAVAEAEAGDFENAKKHLDQALAAAPAAQQAAYRYLQQRFANGQKYATQ